MQPLPHHYRVTAKALPDDCVELTADQLPALLSASPPEFDGPGDRWSPEALLVAALGDCLALTFRGIARASRLPWTSLECLVIGTLDRVDGSTRFVTFDVHPRLEIPAGTDTERARHILEKAERSCLIANSLNGAVHLYPIIKVVGPPDLGVDDEVLRATSH
jgi:organic hydroperoxide reductase OsmC/OhrA